MTSDLSLLCAHGGAGTSPRRSKDRCVQKPSEGKRDKATSDPNPSPNPNPGICRTANGRQAKVKEKHASSTLGVYVESGRDARED